MLPPRPCNSDSDVRGAYASPLTSAPHSPSLPPVSVTSPPLPPTPVSLCTESSNSCREPLPLLFQDQGMDSLDLEACTYVASSRFPGALVQPVQTQGFCSYTLLIRPHSSSFSRTPSFDGHTASNHAFTNSSDGVGMARAKIIQFRPQKFALDIAAMKIARRVHARLVATIGTLGVVRPPQFGLRDDLGEGSIFYQVDSDSDSADETDDGAAAVAVGVDDGKELLVYEMDLLPGSAFSSVQPLYATLTSEEEGKVQKLLEDLAAFFRQSWASQRLPPWQFKQISGKVANSLLERLGKLAEGLPTAALRAVARSAFEDVEAGGLAGLPKVLTHGDLLPSNLLVNEEGGLVGVVDWAETEVLPFGMALYGIERVLGYMTLPSGKGGTRGTSRADELEQEGRMRADSVLSACETLSEGTEVELGKGSVMRFVYYDEAPRLRNFFYQRLEELIPEVKNEESTKALGLAKTVGILLWYGFAWDDGKIDRVVNVQKDLVELTMLEALVKSSELMR